MIVGQYKSLIVEDDAGTEAELSFLLIALLLLVEKIIEDWVVGFIFTAEYSFRQLMIYYRYQSPEL